MNKVFSSGLTAMGDLKTMRNFAAMFVKHINYSFFVSRQIQQINHGK